MDKILAKLDTQKPPNLDHKVVKSLATDLFGLKVSCVKTLPGFINSNYYIETEGEAYVFKVHCGYESRTRHPEGEIAMQQLLTGIIPCPRPVSMKNYTFCHRMRLEDLVSGNSSSSDVDYTDKEKGQFHAVRLQTYLKGQVMMHVPKTPEFLSKTGEILAKLHNIYQNFSHPGVYPPEYQAPWTLPQGQGLRDFVIPETMPEEERTLSLQILDDFDRDVIPNLDHCVHGVIHGDLHDSNILVQQQTTENSQSYEIAGVIDFGDACWSPNVHDLTISIAHFVIANKVQGNGKFDLGKHIIAGYLKLRTLNTYEISMMKTLFAFRVLIVHVFERYYSKLYPENQEYYGMWPTWNLLQEVAAISKEELYERWEINKLTS